MSKKEETLEMAKLYRSGMTLQQIGDQYEITRQRVQQILAGIGITATDRPLKSELLDRERLETLYAAKRLPVEKIGKFFDVSSYQIYSALEFHKIPRRRSLNKDGKYVDVIRLLKIGETTEIHCSSANCYKTLHRSAKCADAKISLRKSGDEKFNVTRIA